MAAIQKPKGTLDILPTETPQWQLIEAAAREQCRIFGFSEIKFPTFESTDLFCRGVGKSTDIVQKEMYSFIDKDGSPLTLRPEGTACVARSVVENGLYAGAMPLSLFYFANFFRREKPQAGRSREFWQFGCELYGSSLPEADATIIALGDGFLKKLGLRNVTLSLNTVGCGECRPAYRKALYDYFSQHVDKLCETCKGRLESNPLRILDCKCPECIAVAEGAPRTVDHVCQSCGDKFARLQKLLAIAGVEYKVDPKVVRGLDYYTGTVFEFSSGDIGAQSAVCGGGRYDTLITELGGPPTPAVGFAMGITRLIMCMKSAGTLPEIFNGPVVYFAPMGSRAADAAFSLALSLRAAGIPAECDICGRSLKAQMKYADKSGAKYAMVIGDNELDSESATLKNLVNGESIKINLSAGAIIDFVTAPERG